MHNWEVSSWDNTHGKLQLVKNPFGKYLTSFFVLQDGPASPVKMAKKPVPVISESEEVDSFKFLCFFSVLENCRLSKNSCINTCLPKKYLFSYSPLKIIYFPNLANKTLELQNIFKRGGGVIFKNNTPVILLMKPIFSVSWTSRSTRT